METHHRPRLVWLVGLALAFGLTACRHTSTGNATAGTGASPAAPSLCTLTVNWDKITGTSKAEPTLQVVVNPPLRGSSPVRSRAYAALRSLGADDVRYVPWLPYPRLAVAELEPAANGKTSWDFSLIDPMMQDLMDATAGHRVVVNFSTIPQWMYKTPKPVPYPADPDQVTWDYEQGAELRDPSLKEVADYYARLVSWYTQGGFRDELGVRHTSDHHFKIDTWEVLNEIDFEHHMTPETYTAVYDAITAAIRKIDPSIKFMGLALAAPSDEPRFFEYFLNPKNHEPGAPLDTISYHFYASPAGDEPPEAWPYTFFDQASRFLNVVRYVQAIRQRLSPATRTDLDEIGAILPDDNATPRAAIPASYWNLCSSMYAYLYGNLASLGVDVVGESQLVGCPSQFPSVSMVNWTSGQPNARFWTLKLLHSHFGPGDKLAETSASAPYVYVQGFVKPDGTRALLVASQRNRPFELAVPGAAGGTEEFVDQTTGEQPPASVHLQTDRLTLGGFGVAVVTLPSAAAAGR
ncbi:MAG TPA: glycosyl hydrolase family 39 [Terriglobia bacterium]|nr:glycosyl hydrolase family 39 [Terriglobia bacterium]